MTCCRPMPGPLRKAGPPANNATVRTVFVIGPDKKIKLMLIYPMSTGRNFDEVLRVLDSMQLTAKHKVATPVNWKKGEDVIILPAVSDEEAKQKYPGGWKTAEAVSADRAAAEVTGPEARGGSHWQSPANGTSSAVSSLPPPPWVDATAITDATCEKIVLMSSATPGITAPAATATKPAIKAYSMRS